MLNILFLILTNNAQPQLLPINLNITGVVSATPPQPMLISTLLKNGLQPLLLMLKQFIMLLGKLNHLLLMLMLLTGPQSKALLCTKVDTFGLMLANLNALVYSTVNSINGNKELASSPEDFLNLLLDTVLEVLPSLSSVELVEVFTLKLLMSVPILSVKSSRILKKMILPTQELLPITSVIT
jgi:hypothetical protein